MAESAGGREDSTKGGSEGSEADASSFGSTERARRDGRPRPPSAVMVRGWISRASREIRDRDQRRAAMEADAITDEQVEEFLAKAKTVPELTDRVDWAASLDRSTRWTAVYTIFLILKEASVQEAVAVKRGSPR